MDKTNTTVRLDRLKEHPKNPRNHGDTQIEALGESLDLYGQFRRVVVDEDYTILAGHGVTEAMRRRGYTKVDVYQIRGLSEEEKLKFLLVDNRIQSMANEDLDAVTQIIKEIGDVDIPGYDEEVLQSILNDSEEAMNKTFDEHEQREYGQEIGGAGGGDFFESGSTDDPTVTAVQVKEIKGSNREFIECPHCGEEIWLKR